MDVPPGFLYKYCNHAGVSILRGLRLKVTPACDFADPFDFAPAFIADDLPRSKLDKAGEEFRRRNCKDFGVFCASARRDSLLLWALYADGHKGFVVGIDPSEWVGSRATLVQVKYSRERPKIKITRIDQRTAEERFNNAVDALRLKSPDWRFEKEWRCVFENSNLKPYGRSRTDRYAEISASMIRVVILGAKCSDKTEQAIRRQLAKPRFSKVKLLRGHLDPLRFRIAF